MKFTVAGSRILCSRKDNTVEADEAYRHVVDFDAHVDTVPPHVAARLTSFEVGQLEEFIVDRRRIQANPVERNMLEALPGLLQEAAAILDSENQINQAMYSALSTSIADLSASLENVRPAAERRSIPVKGMRHSEAQKERLENIKQKL